MVLWDWSHAFISPAPITYQGDRIWDGGREGGRGWVSEGMKTNPPCSLKLPQQFRLCDLATFTVKSNRKPFKRCSFNHAQNKSIAIITAVKLHHHQHSLTRCHAQHRHHHPNFPSSCNNVHVPCGCNLCTEGPAWNHSGKQTTKRIYRDLSALFPSVDTTCNMMARLPAGIAKTTRSLVAAAQLTACIKAPHAPATDEEGHWRKGKEPP